jgi:hypothetical protein
MCNDVVIMMSLITTYRANKPFALLIFGQEIDGRALLLLNRDMIMSYMGLKLGPAIKLLNIVQELKPDQICEL